MIYRINRISVNPLLLHLPIPALHHVERFLFLATIRYQAFAVPVVLDARSWPAGGAEVHQDPRRGAAEKGNFLKHRDLVFKNTFLIFFGPASQ